MKTHPATILAAIFAALALTAAPAPATTFTKIADTDTPVPGGGGNFADFTFKRPGLSGTAVVFQGTDESTLLDGIYSTAGGSLGVVADTTTAIPAGAGSFTGFGSPANFADTPGKSPAA